MRYPIEKFRHVFRGGVIAVTAGMTCGCVAFFPSAMDRKISSPTTEETTDWDKALVYTKIIRADIDDKQTELATTRESFKYASLLTGLGTTVAAAAKASGDIILGFGAATGTASTVNYASGMDDKAKVLSRGQQALACLQYAADTLHAPLPTPPKVPYKSSFAALEREKDGRLVKLQKNTEGFVNGEDILNAFLNTEASNLMEMNSQALSGKDLNLKVSSKAAANAFSVLTQVQSAQLTETQEQLKVAIGNLKQVKSQTDQELPKILSTNAWEIHQSIQRQLTEATPVLDDVISKAKGAIEDKSKKETAAAQDVKSKSTQTKAQAAATQEAAFRLSLRMNPDENALAADKLRAEALALPVAIADVAQQNADDLQRLVDEAQKCNALTNPPKDTPKDNKGGKQ